MSPDSPAETARRLEAEIARLREELGGLVGELDRRRHELLDVKLQVKRHSLALTLTGVSLGAATLGLVRLGTRRGRSRGSLLARAGRVLDVGTSMRDRPPRGGAAPTVRRLATVAMAAKAGIVKSGLAAALLAALARRWRNQGGALPADAARPVAVAAGARGPKRHLAVAPAAPRGGETRP